MGLLALALACKFAFRALRGPREGRAMRSKVRGSGLAGTTNLALRAPVREGLAPAFEPVSYLERLRRLLNAMHASRRNA